jgi:nitronate monooxygenase
LPDRRALSVVGLQRPGLPLFSPVAPTVGMPASSVDTTALYAGQTVLRITSVISARQAVAELAPGGQ